MIEIKETRNQIRKKEKKTAQVTISYPHSWETLPQLALFSSSEVVKG